MHILNAVMLKACNSSSADAAQLRTVHLFLPCVLIAYHACAPLNNVPLFSPSSNDKNLCSKALVSGVTACSKRDLEAEVGRCRRAVPPLQDIKTSAPPPVPSAMLSTDYTSVQPHSHESAGLSLGRIKEGEPGTDVRAVSSWERGNCLTWCTCPQVFLCFCVSIFQICW